MDACVRADTAPTARARESALAIVPAIIGRAETSALLLMRRLPQQAARAARLASAASRES